MCFNKCLYVLAGIFWLLSTIAFADLISSHDDVRQYNLGLGKKIFHTKCIKCHGDIEFDAPMFRDIEDWSKRIETPVDELVHHAINGHGEMPAKGGFDKLTDRQVGAAVAYVVDQTRRLIINTNGTLAINTEVCNSPSANCTPEEIDNFLVMQLLMLLTNQK